MKTILFATAVALGLSTGAAFATASPSGDVPTQAKLAFHAETAQQFHSIGTVPAMRGIYSDPSRSNPTGQVEYGPNNTISLFGPSPGGNG
jgi:hypothetical protein